MPPLLALFSWPLVVLALARRFPPALAFILAILAGFLLLPETIEFDLPLLPALTKHSIPVLTVLLFIAMFRPGRHEHQERPLLPQNGFVWIATVGIAVSSLFTVTTNGDPLFYGPTMLPGMRLYDGLSQALSALIMLLPMLLARKFLASPETHVLLLKVLCVAGLGYSLLALVEVRMSPQMNNWVYGFFPHSFVQHFRAGGWRPIVFMSHGLVLSIFFCITILAIAGLTRLEPVKRGIFIAALLWLIFTLVMCKSLGAMIIMICFLPAVLFLGVRGQLIVACAIACLVLSFPIGRSSGFIPIQKILQQAEKIDPQRAESLLYRVQNEDMVLNKAKERPVFGWGAWGRSRVFDSNTGADITISDGYWVGVLGVGGWARYLFEFGLLCIPLILLFLRAKHYGIGMESSVLALMLAANLVDLIPNSSVTPLTWMIAGALWGRLELGLIDAQTTTELVTASKRGQPSYNRSGKLNKKNEAISIRQGQYTRQHAKHSRGRDQVAQHEQD